MKAIINHLEVEVSDDHYRGSPIDNPQKYFRIFNAGDGNPFNAAGIRIFETGELLNSALITAPGGGSRIHEKSVIFENQRLIVCCGNCIFCLSVPGLDLIWKKECDMATCFGVYAYKSDYIVHGELEISRLSHNGHLIWQHGGADIFTEIKVDDVITATDFYQKQYQFDFEGNLLGYDEDKSS